MAIFCISVHFLPLFLTHTLRPQQQGELAKAAEQTGRCETLQRLLTAAFSEPEPPFFSLHCCWLSESRDSRLSTRSLCTLPLSHQIYSGLLETEIMYVTFYVLCIDGWFVPGNYIVTNYAAIITVFLRQMYTSQGFDQWDFMKVCANISDCQPIFNGNLYVPKNKYSACRLIQQLEIGH